MGKSSYVIDF